MTLQYERRRGEDMSDPTSGYELLRERENLERVFPDLVSGYQSFLRDFSQFQAMQRKFVDSARRSSFDQPAFAARFK